MSLSSSSTISGISRIWRAMPSRSDRRLQPLIDEALVRGMLIDDHHAVAGLRHDIGFVHLRARGPERAVEQIGRNLRHARARIGGRRDRLERLLRGFRESERGIAVGRESCGAAGERRQSQLARGMAAGRNAAMVASPPPDEARRASPRQRLAQRADDQRAHEAGIAKAHLGLGGMHVHIHFARIERHE